MISNLPRSAGALRFANRYSFLWILVSIIIITIYEIPDDFKVIGCLRFDLYTCCNILPLFGVV